MGKKKKKKKEHDTGHIWINTLKINEKLLSQ